MSDYITYREVQNFVLTYSTDLHPYDPNGVLHLMLVGVDNLREHARESDLVTFACAISDEQAALMRALLDARPQSIAEMEAGT